MAKEVQLVVGGQQETYQGVRDIVTGGQHSTEAWVPEDETSMARLDAKENGTYTPEVYAYSRANVLVKGGDAAYVEVERDGQYVIEWVTPDPATSPDAPGMVGRGPDGETYYVYVAQDGTIAKVKVPSSAEVETQPATTSYADGDAMDWTGTEIALYYADGSLATEWDDGLVSYGTAAWGNHVSTPQEPLRSGQTVIEACVLGFWLRGGTELGQEYGLVVQVHVTVE